MPQETELNELNAGTAALRLSAGRRPAVLPAAFIKSCVKAS